jgi:hypothetical protein
MKRPDDIRKELEELSPRLLNIKEQGEGFNLPPNYFQTLQNQVLEKLKADEPAHVNNSVATGPSWWDQVKAQLQFLLQPRWALSLATIALLVSFGLGWMLQQNQADGSKLNTELAKLDQQTLDAYIQDNLHEFDTETLLEFASIQGIRPNFDELAPEELDQYLDQLIQDLDEETIKELL